VLLALRLIGKVQEPRYFLSKQLEYFWLQDQEINKINKDMVKAILNLINAIALCQNVAYITSHIITFAFPTTSICS
jgi:hypothetical protein